MPGLEELTDAILDFFNRLAAWETAVIRDSDITVSEAHALEVLGQFGVMNMKQLASRLGVTTGTTTATVDRLEKKAYAARQPSPEDRRVQMIHLTPAGRQAFAEHHRRHLELTEELVAALSPERARAFLETLRQVNDSFPPGVSRNGKKEKNPAPGGDGP